MVEKHLSGSNLPKNEMKKAMVISGFCNDYQSCLKFYNGHAHQNSPFLNV
jgi:hypothetical protein